MNFEKNEFNEYGVRTTYQPYQQHQGRYRNASPKLTVIVAVTVLFSIFNFIVGYMIGKFLGNSGDKPVVIQKSDLLDSNAQVEVTGIPSNKREVSNDSSRGEETVLDLEAEPLLDNKAPDISYRNSPPSQVRGEKKTISQEQSQKRNTSSGRTGPQKAERKTPSPNVSKYSGSAKYYIQVSSNEKRDMAESTVNKLKLIGLDGFIQEANVNGKKVYRVRVGGFSSYDDAMKGLEKARKIDNSAFLVVGR